MYSADARATFLALMTHLGPEGDPDEVVAFVRDHWAQSLEEVGARPGWDQVRAGLLRVLPRLVDRRAREEALDAAGAALAAYPEDAASGEPAVLLARHPAWVGLAAMELAAARAESERVPEGAVRDAVRLATPGFEASARQAVGRGEVLWAMAEQAEEVGWHDRAGLLLRGACAGPFSDPANGQRVRLLLGLRLAEDGDPDAVDALEIVADDDAAEGRTRVHALWVLSALARRAGAVEDARLRMQRALSLIDEEEEPDVATRIRAALDDLDDLDD